MALEAPEPDLEGADEEGREYGDVEVPLGRFWWLDLGILDSGWGVTLQIPRDFEERLQQLEESFQVRIS